MNCLDLDSIPKIVHVYANIPKSRINHSKSETLWPKAFWIRDIEEAKAAGWSEWQKAKTEDDRIW